MFRHKSAIQIDPLGEGAVEASLCLRSAFALPSLCLRYSFAPHNDPTATPQRPHKEATSPHKHLPQRNCYSCYSATVPFFLLLYVFRELCPLIHTDKWKKVLHIVNFYVFLQHQMAIINERKSYIST